MGSHFLFRWLKEQTHEMSFWNKFCLILLLSFPKLLQNPFLCINELGRVDIFRPPSATFWYFWYVPTCFDLERITFQLLNTWTLKFGSCKMSFVSSRLSCRPNVFPDFTSVFKTIYRTDIQKKWRRLLRFLFLKPKETPREFAEAFQRPWRYLGSVVEGGGEDVPGRLLESSRKNTREWVWKHLTKCYLFAIGRYCTFWNPKIPGKDELGNSQTFQGLPFIWVDTSKSIKQNLGTTWRLVEISCPFKGYCRKWKKLWMIIRQQFLLVVIHRPLRASRRDVFFWETFPIPFQGGWEDTPFICHQLGGQAVSSTKKVWDVYSHQSLNLRRPGRSRWLFVAKLSRNERIHVVAILQSIFLDKGVSKNGGTPKSLILIGFSIINHPFWGTPIFGNTHIVVALPCSFVNSIVFFMRLSFLCGPALISSIAVWKQNDLKIVPAQFCHAKLLSLLLHPRKLTCKVKEARHNCRGPSGTTVSYPHDTLIPTSRNPISWDGVISHSKKFHLWSINLAKLLTGLQGERKKKSTGNVVVE